jgi:GxxExxY protein
MGGEERDPLTEQVIGAAIEVHRVLGPGLLESVYQKCLCHELRLRGIEHESLVRVPLVYKGVPLDSELVMDVVLPGQLVVELKAVEKVLPVHEAQLLTYMKLSSIHLGLLLNFNVPVLKQGIKRMVL